MGVRKLGMVFDLEVDGVRVRLSRVSDIQTGQTDTWLVLTPQSSQTSREDNDISCDIPVFPVNNRGVRENLENIIFILNLIIFRVSALSVSPVRYRLCRHEGGQVKVINCYEFLLSKFMSGC